MTVPPVPPPLPFAGGWRKEEDSISIKEVTGHHDRLSNRTKAATVYDWTPAQLGASTFAPTTVNDPDFQHSQTRAFQASEIYIYNTWMYCPSLERLVPALVLPRARDIQVHAGSIPGMDDRASARQGGSLLKTRPPGLPSRDLHSLTLFSPVRSFFSLSLRLSVFSWSLSLSFLGLRLGPCGHLSQGYRTYDVGNEII